jgi:hypothetical protein
VLNLTAPYVEPSQERRYTSHRHARHAGTGRRTATIAKPLRVSQASRASRLDRPSLADER